MRPQLCKKCFDLIDIPRRVDYELELVVAQCHEAPDRIQVDTVSFVRLGVATSLALPGR